MSGSGGLATATIVESSRLIPWLMLTNLVAGLALGLAILSVVLGQLAEREARLAQYDVKIMQTKLAEHGIVLDEHETTKENNK